MDLHLDHALLLFFFIVVAPSTVAQDIEYDCTNLVNFLDACWIDAARGPSNEFKNECCGALKKYITTITKNNCICYRERSFKANAQLAIYSDACYSNEKYFHFRETCRKLNHQIITGSV